MADTYPVVPSRWLGSLTHLLEIGGKNSDRAEPLEAQAFRLFSQFLTLKIALTFAFTNGMHWPLNLKTIAIFLVILVSILPRYYHVGRWATLGLSFYDFWSSLPFTINHTGLEFGIMLLICLMPNDESKTSGISCGDMVKILMLSVWFFSGIHKLFDGYYWNAEFFALEALANETTLGHRLNYILGIFGPLLGPGAQSPLACCTNGTFLFSHWQVGILLLFSWLTIFIEIALPLSFLSTKLRPLAIVSIFIFQSFITYFSGEIDFAFTAFAILFLFVPKLAPFTYPSLACLLLVVQPWS